MAMRHGIYYEPVPSPMNALKQKYGANRTELAKLEELAPWHCTALARHVVYGQALSEVVKDMPGRHSAETIRQVAKSPAGQAYIAQATEALKDPVKLVKDLAKSDVAEMYFTWQMARDWAVQAKDYEAIHKMAKDIGLQPVLDSAEKTGPTTISLHLNMHDLATPPVKTSFQVMEAEIVEEGTPDE